MPAQPHVRRLALPGGGEITVPMPADSRMYVQGPPSLSYTPIPKAVPIAAGAILGGALTWLFLHLSR